MNHAGQNRILIAGALGSIDFLAAFAGTWVFIYAMDLGPWRLSDSFPVLVDRVGGLFGGYGWIHESAVLGADLPWFRLTLWASAWNGTLVGLMAGIVAWNGFNPDNHKRGAVLR